MIVTRRSNLTGKVHSMDLPVTQQQLDRYNRKIEHLQDVFPNLPASHREFIKTGITPKEWDEIFNDANDDKDHSDLNQHLHGDN